MRVKGIGVQLGPNEMAVDVSTDRGLKTATLPSGPLAMPSIYYHENSDRPTIHFGQEMLVSGAIAVEGWLPSMGSQLSLLRTRGRTLTAKHVCRDVLTWLRGYLKSWLKMDIHHTPLVIVVDSETILMPQCRNAYLSAARSAGFSSVRLIGSFAAIANSYRAKAGVLPRERAAGSRRRIRCSQVAILIVRDDGAFELAAPFEQVTSLAGARSANTF